MKTTVQNQDSATLFTAGIACHAVVVAENVGLFNVLLERPLHKRELDRHFGNRLPVIGALDALAYADIVEERATEYVLTDLGRDIAENAEVFRLWFEAYSGLLAGQVAIAKGERSWNQNDINGRVVAEASAMIGEKRLDHAVLDLLRDLEPMGTICDLGCGVGKRLTTLCKEFQVEGLGFDLNEGAVQTAQQVIANVVDRLPRVQVLLGDVTRLDGCWPEVDILMQTFMTHHIIPDDFCVAVMRSYHQKFPNARYFVILETVTAEDELVPQMFAPGFDYIHRLQGLEPRTKRAAHRIFAEAGFTLDDERVLDVPNSYAWILKRA